MKISYTGILVIILVIAMLTISGCIGGGGGGAATATPKPGTSGSVTPAPTQPGSSSGSVFNMDNLKMYEYKLTTNSGGETTSSTYKIEYTDSTYEGAPAKQTKMTYSMPGSGGQMVVNMYYSMSDDHLLGGMYTMNAGGQTIEIPIEADEGDTYSGNDWASSTADDFDDMSGWTSAGSETLTANGHSYNCAKHTWAYGSISYSIWTNDQAPMPMKYHWVDNQGNSWTMELLNWN